MEDKEEKDEAPSEEDDSREEGHRIIEQLLEECLTTTLSRTEWDVTERGRLLKEGGQELKGLLTLI